MSCKVSVLTPVYNVEAYLRQCLDSLANQTLKEIEFICINDGSTDGSLAILQSYAETDSRFIVINKKNGGYGSAMNVGLSHAHGEYIGILESDDFAEPSMFEKLYNAAKENNCDIAKSNYYQHSGSLGSFEKENFADSICDQVFCPTDPSKASVIFTVPSIWSAVYRRTFLLSNKINFLETPGASFQDTGFVYKSWLAAERAILIHDFLVHYRVNRLGSSVKSNSKVFCVCDEWESIDRFIGQRPDVKNRVLPFVQAQKFITYSWNYSRIGTAHKEDFLRKVAEEFKKPYTEHTLDGSQFSKAQWNRLLRIIDDPSAVYKRDRELEKIQSPLALSVIIPFRKNGQHLRRLLNSIEAQTFSNYEVLLVGDETADESLRFLGSFVRAHPKFKIIPQNDTAKDPRNTALFYARGKYLVFAKEDGIIPIASYEKLVRSMACNNADMAVGRMTESSPLGKATYHQTEVHSKSNYIDAFDSGFFDFPYLCNKIFRRDLVSQNDLSFSNDANEADAAFLANYLAKAKRIVGCNAEVYKHRNSSFLKEAVTAMDDAPITAVELQIDCLNRMKDILHNEIDSRLSSIDAVDDGPEINRLIFSKAAIYESANEKIVTALIESYRHNIWRLSSDEFARLESVFKQSIQLLSKHKRKAVLEDDYHKDLRLAETKLPSSQQLALSPLMSIIISKSMHPQIVSNSFRALFTQPFPAFEIIAPKSLAEHIPSAYKERLNVHLIDDDQGNLNWIQSAISATRAPYINILSDAIYHNSESLRLMWEKATASRADFVSCNLRCISKNGKRRRIPEVKQVFAPSQCDSPSKRSAINQFDYSLNNKVFKKHVLLKQEKELSRDLNNFSRTAYKSLSFEKAPDVSLLCLESRDKFSGSASHAVRMTALVERGIRFVGSPTFRNRCTTYFGNLSKSAMAKLPSSQNALFFTSRNNGELSANLQLVYDALPNVKKKVFCEALPHSARYDRRVTNAILRSSIIITDDYCPYLRNVQLRPDQFVIQLWHACGAFKKFGIDYKGASISDELALHRQYSAAMTSSEFIRPIYAKAFGVQPDKVLPLGVPRTDLLLDKSRIDAKRSEIHAQYPILNGKKVVLYAPTFRQHIGRQFVWDCSIDWQWLSSHLEKDVVLVVKRHPLEPSTLLRGSFDNIIECIDADDIGAVALADLLITDYSSLIFDFALMNKPFIFYCPDIDSYEGDFYLPFPDNFKETFCDDFKSLPDMIQSALNLTGPTVDNAFREKYLGACDGNSTKRIVEYINNLINEKQVPSRILRTFPTAS